MLIPIFIGTHLYFKYYVEQQIHSIYKTQPIITKKPEGLKYA